MKEILLPLGTPPQPAAHPGNFEKKRQPRHRFKHKDVNQGRESFAHGINFYKLAWIFIIGCVIGVVFETIFVWATTGVYMRRSGMLYGPFNQIYGFGALLFTIFLYRFRKYNAIIIFLASMVLGMAFEYACSWIQEVVFHTRSWDYSNMPLNIGGRVNLLYGVGWGLMGLIFLNHIWPFLSEMIERIPNRIGKPLTILFVAFLVFDMALSGLAVWRMSERTQGVPATNFVEVWLDESYPNTVMAKKYPSMTTDMTAKTTSEGFHSNVKTAADPVSSSRVEATPASAPAGAASGSAGSQSSPG